MKIIALNDTSDAGFLADEQTAIGILDATFGANITVYISIGYGDINGTTLPNQSISEGGPNLAYLLSYAQLRTDLMTAVPGFFNGANLPAGTSINGASNFWVSSSEAKVFGILPAANSTIDGFVGIGTNFGAGAVRVSALLHEIGHALGRVPSNINVLNNVYYPALDLFRFTDHQGDRLFDGTVNPPAAGITPAHFSLDGGTTYLADWGVHSDPSDFLNPPNSLLPGPYSNLTPNDPFNEIVGNLANLTAVDVLTMEALGFSTNTTVDWASRLNEKALAGKFFSGGKAGIVTIGAGQGGIGSYLSNGDGTFHTVFSQQSPSTDWDSLPGAKMVAGDFLHNGLTDIAVISPGQNGIAAYLSNGAGGFSTVFSSQVNSHTDWDSWPNAQVVSGDFLGNGFADIAVFNPGQGGIADYLSLGNGTFRAVFSPQTATHTDWASWPNPQLVTGDFLHNGRTDIAVINPGQGGIATYLPSNDGTFTAKFSAQTATHTDWDSWPHAKAVAGDFLGNGYTDIAVLNPDQGGIADYLSLGDGTFRAVFSSQTASHSDWDSWPNPTVVTGDFLGNGHIGIAVMSPGQGGIALYLPNADGTFSAVFSPQLASHTDWDSWPNPTVVVGDFLGNGHAGIAVMNPGQGGIAVYEANSSGVFTASFTFAAGSAAMSVAGISALLNAEAAGPPASSSQTAGASIVSAAGQTSADPPAGTPDATVTAGNVVTLAGNDNFVFNSLGDPQPGGGHLVTIADFVSGVDHLDFSAISGISALQATDPVAPGSVLNPHSLAWSVNGDGVDLFANAGNNPQQIGGAGSLAPDMQVHLTHVAALLASDFQLHI